MKSGRLVGRSRELSKKRAAQADVAQLAERVLGKDEVTSSILVIGSTLRSPLRGELRVAGHRGARSVGCPANRGAPA